MKTIQETVKDAVAESLDELRQKSITKINEKELVGGQEVEKKEIREKAIQDAFREFARTGEIRTKSVQMEELVAENGGMTVPQNIFDKIIEKSKEYGVMRNFAHTDRISVGNSMEFILEDGDFGSAWVGENDERESTGSGTFKSVTVGVHELWAEPIITRWLLKDSMFNLEDYIVRKVGETFGKAEEVAFWYGDGDKKPVGLLNGLGAGDYKGINYKNLTEAIYDLDEEYAGNSVFFLNRKTMKTIKNLVDGNNRPLFVETTELSRKFEGMLLGYPVKFVSALKEDEIVFGDMEKAYAIVDKANDTGMLFDELTLKGKVKYPTWKRTGGKSIKREAFKYITK